MDFVSWYPAGTVCGSGSAEDGRRGWQQERCWLSAMNLTHPITVGAFVLLAMLVVAISVLAGLHDKVPTVLENLAYVLGGVGGTSAIATNVGSTKTQ